MNKGIKYIFFLLILSLLFIYPIFVYAQNVTPKYGLIISPLIEEFKAKPGDTINGSFKVTDDFQDETRKVTLYPYAKDFTSDGTSGSPLWINYKDPNEIKVDSSLESWITLSDKEIDITKQGISKNVNFTIKVPANASGGTKQAGILVTETKNGSFINDSTQVGIASEIAGLVFVEVEGERSIDLEISNMSLTDIDENTQLFNIFEYLPVNINVNVRNNGNSIAEPTGDIFISPIGKTETFPTIKFNQLGGRILPKSTRLITENWNDAFLTISNNQLPSNPNIIDNIFNKYNLNTNFGKLLRIGVFDLTLKLLYFDTNNNAEVRTQNATLIIFPWKFTIVIVILIVSIIIFKKIKNKRSKVKKALLVHKPDSV